MITIDLKRPITIETALTRLTRGLYVGHADSKNVFRMAGDGTLEYRPIGNLSTWLTARSMSTCDLCCAEETPTQRRRVSREDAIVAMVKDPDLRVWDQLGTEL